MEKVADAVHLEIEAATTIPKSTVNEILKKLQIKPFHFTPVQSITQADHVSRLNFCNEMLEAVNEEPDFLSKILWTDECLFTRQGLFNSHNSHYYSEQNSCNKKFPT